MRKKTTLDTPRPDDLISTPEGIMKRKYWFAILKDKEKLRRKRDDRRFIKYGKIHYIRVQLLDRKVVVPYRLGRNEKQEWFAKTPFGIVPRQELGQFVVQEYEKDIEYSVKACEFFVARARK